RGVEARGVFVSGFRWVTGRCPIVRQILSARTRRSKLRVMFYLPPEKEIFQPRSWRGLACTLVALCGVSSCKTRASSTKLEASARRWVTKYETIPQLGVHGCPRSEIFLSCGS